MDERGTQVDPDSVGFTDDPDCRCARVCGCVSESVDTDLTYDR